ncbi:segregation/condensation protein A [Ligilactobacillus salivarius]|uniref:Segregation and condensation protein A n=1 Tax=Ligilactobacillus salivarius TaxID=1624 RepID=A0AAW7N6R3_9LACO|nr:segregation/condensation protein A [Ligilactobacillus salivarius]MDN4833364.1 segregation/condensation protein A [Ligilactobacillus salivarius]
MAQENKQNSRTAEHLTFKLDQFKGPLDLLLHLIKQNEMDIYDIQVAEITSQYIDYLHQMQDLRLDIAGEYLVIAATLLNIKSKMLLPVEQEQQVEEDYVDPREDLVQQLVSHQLYQEVAAKFHVMEKQRMELFSREQAVNEDVTYEVSEGTTIDLLQKAFAKLMARKQVKKIKKIKRKIIPERYTIKEEIENIEHTLKMHKGTMNFTDLFNFDGEVEVEKVVTSFLALLELVRVGRVSASQEENNGPILMTYEGKAEEDAI